MAEFTDQQLADLLYTLGLSPNNPRPLHARLNVLETNVSSMMSKLDGLTARPAFDPATLTAALVPALAPALADALPDNVNAAQIVAAFDDPHVQGVLAAMAKQGVIDL
jgi:hypothetical protein